MTATEYKTLCSKIRPEQIRLILLQESRAVAKKPPDAAYFCLPSDSSIVNSLQI